MLNRIGAGLLDRGVCPVCCKRSWKFHFTKYYFRYAVLLLPVFVGGFLALAFQAEVLVKIPEQTVAIKDQVMVAKFEKDTIIWGGAGLFKGDVELEPYEARTFQAGVPMFLENTRANIMVWAEIETTGTPEGFMEFRQSTWFVHTHQVLVSHLFDISQQFVDLESGLHTRTPGFISPLGADPIRTLQAFDNVLSLWDIGIFKLEDVYNPGSTAQQKIVRDLFQPKIEPVLLGTGLKLTHMWFTRPYQTDETK